MLIVQIKDDETIERALKRYRKKFEKAGILKELKERKHYISPAEKRRNIIQRAIFIQKLKDGLIKKNKSK